MLVQNVLSLFAALLSSVVGGTIDYVLYESGKILRGKTVLEGTWD